MTIALGPSPLLLTCEILRLIEGSFLSNICIFDSINKYYIYHIYWRDPFVSIDYEIISGTPG